MKISHFNGGFFIFISVIVFGTLLPASPQHIGCIDPACDVAAVIVSAYDSARFVCDGLAAILMKFQFCFFSKKKKIFP